MTFYSSATGAGWIVPKKYVEKVGDDGFKKAPVGAGPYKFVSFTPGRGAGARGLRAVLAQGAEREAAGLQGRSPTSPRAWPRSSAARWTSPTRSAARSPRSSGARPGLTLKPDRRPGARSGSTSPSSGTRSRRGTTGACAWPRTSPSTGRRSTRPRRSGFSQDHRQHHPAAASSSSGSRPRYAVRSRAGQAAPRRGRLSRTASTPATTTATPSYANIARGRGQLPAARSASARSCGRSSARPSSRSYAEKKSRTSIQGGSGAFGNAATRLEAFVAAGGAYVYGSYPDIDGLFQRAGRASSTRKRREATAAPDPAARPRQGDVRADLAKPASTAVWGPRGGVRARAHRRLSRTRRRTRT